MKKQHLSRVLALCGALLLCMPAGVMACDDDWLQVTEAQTPANLTRARLARDLRVGFDGVPLERVIASIQERTGLRFTVHWNELATLNLARATPMRLMPWRVTSVNKALNDILGDRITDRPVISINADGTIRVPGVKLVVVEVVVLKDIAPAPGLPAGANEDDEPLPPDSGDEPQADGAGPTVAGPDGDDAQMPAPGLPSDQPSDGSDNRPSKQTPPGKPSNTGRFVEIVPVRDLQPRDPQPPETKAPVAADQTADRQSSENDRLIGRLTRRGVRFHPHPTQDGLIATIAPTALSDEVLELLSRVRNVVELNVGDCEGGTQITDAGLAAIGRMTQLTGLSLRQSGYTGAGFEAISKLQNLQWIDLGHANLQPRQWGIVGALPKLQRVRATKMTVQPEDFQALATSKTIKAIQIDSTMTADDWTFAFEALAGFDTLEELMMPVVNFSVMERGLSRLRLKKIRLYGTGLFDDHMQLLAGMKTLSDITLSDTFNLTGEGYKALATLPDLKRFTNTGLVNEQALASLRAAHGLEALSLNSVGVTGETLSWIGTLKNLRELELYGGKFNDDGLLKLAGLSKLKLLMLSSNRQLTDRGVAVIGNMPELEKLYLCGTGITDKSLAGISRLKQLIRLDLCHTGISEAGLATLAGMPKLAELTLGGKQTDAALASLAAVKSLRLLEIHGSRFTAAGLNSLRAGNVDMRVKIWN
jgi:Leucine-rich repeat (LRR) protein